MVKEVKNGMTFMRERKAISPVIATVILVAVAITVAVGVSYWMGGISSQYTNFEKVEIQSGYAIVDASTNVGWNITLVLKNTGTTATTINGFFINDIPVQEYSITNAAGLTVATDNGISCAQTGTVIDTGSSATLYVLIGSGNLSSGTTVNVKLHSSGGMDYVKLIRLP